MDTHLAQSAISAAIAGNWKQAAKINKALLKKDSKDTDALNRLARAHAELGELDKARKCAEKVLKLDPFNNIATKSLTKWKGLTTNDPVTNHAKNANIFLEEPGKTKTLQLRQLGSPALISTMSAGDEVKLNAHGHRVTICTVDGKLIGRLSDDISGRIRKLIGHGNEYEVYIKSAMPEEVKVFIRETKRGKEVEDIHTFPTDKLDNLAVVLPQKI